MIELKLSKRLCAVSKAVPSGKTVADIGSDHALLPCALCLSNKVPRAVAGEVIDGPYQAALAQVQKWQLGDVVSVRKGDGLDVIAPGEVDVVVIAGMGGKLIRDILERGKNKLAGVSRLILQPNMAAMATRLWLMKHGWELIDETILEEDKKVYEVLVAEPGDGRAPYRTVGEAALWAGPFLMKEKNAAFRKKWRAEISKWKNIYVQLQRATQTEEVVARQRNLLEKIKKTEEMLNG
jgi:tRNA (adenine22-N1)-methyltransferase